jgi:hypothetical protein
MAAERVPEPSRNSGNRGATAGNPAGERRTLADPDEDLAFTDDLDFEETFGDPSGMTLGMKIATTLMILVAVVMVVYLVLLVLYPERYGPEDWIGAKAPKQAGAKAPSLEALKGFELGGIQLGLPADEAFKVYPSMQFTPNPKGGRIGAYQYHEGQFQVFFHGLEKSGRAYRIESRHVFTKISYLELLTELSQRYGQPSKSECGAGDEIIAIECHLVWTYPTFGLSANIKTTVSDDGSRASTALRVIAIDIRPDSFFTQPAETKKSIKGIGRPE